MRRVSHLSVAEGCLRSLWKSGSKKEALELTRPSGGAVVQRVHRPRPAWPERLVDSAARTDAMWVPSQDQFSAKDATGRCGVRRTRRIPDWPPRWPPGGCRQQGRPTRHPCACRPPLGGVHCATTTLWYWRCASVVYPDVPVLAVPSRHRSARTAGHNRTKRYQPAPQVTYKHIMELARNRQVGGSNPPSGSRSEHMLGQRGSDRCHARVTTPSVSAAAASASGCEWT